MQAIWKACFLLPLIFHRECVTAVDGGSQDAPAHNIEERALESTENPNNTTMLRLFSAALTFGTRIIRKLPEFGRHSLNSKLFSEEGDTTKKAPSWAEIFEDIANAIMAKVPPVVHIGSRPCYPKIGCFKEEENMSLPYGGPLSPDKVGTVFYFFHNNSRNGTRPLVSRIWTLDNWTTQGLNYSDKPLMIVTHGFTGNIDTPWLMPLVDALLVNVNCNVIVADWRNGSAGPNYATAAANSPMAGVEISLLLIKIINATNCALHPDNVTLIGFSLGAHVVGFAGRHFYKNTSMLLGRITGLDPAGMLFEGTNVSLSRHDAKFVDVIHTNMGDIKTLQLGLRGTQGHVDFYPNGGDYQPGCRKHPNLTIFTLPKDLNISLSSLTTVGSPNEALLSVMESVACSHYRAPLMFTESLTNHNCSFTSYPCPHGWEDFDNCSKMFKDNDTVKGLMGYYSITKKGRGLQYLRTNNATPFCINDSQSKIAVL